VAAPVPTTAVPTLVQSLRFTIDSMRSRNARFASVLLLWLVVVMGVWDMV
jgi:hypothetical protein